MTAGLKTITNSLKTRPPAQRLEAADMLYADSSEPDPEAINRTGSVEVKRRLDEYRTGKAVLYAEEHVHARIQKVLDEPRHRAGRHR